MAEYIRVYRYNETEFKSGGLGVLHNARDICISSSIDGERTLEFALSPAPEDGKTVTWELVGAPAEGTDLTDGTLQLADAEVGTLMVVANVNDTMTYAVINVEAKPEG